jgi:hypothetical protein
MSFFNHLDNKKIPKDFQNATRTLKPLIKTSIHLTEKEVEAQKACTLPGLQS